MALPDFIIIGAMKCGTSTLAAQLAAQEDVFMTTPKEPNFFSDDEIYAKGMDWYENLFRNAKESDLKGEASTHYTKLPTYPECLPRLQAALGDLKLIYMTRDPIDRLVSHYIHEWTTGVITSPIEEAIDKHPELIAYSKYGMQIAPYVDVYGKENIMHLSLSDLKNDSQASLDKVCAFLGLKHPAIWVEDLAKQNVSKERIREFPGYNLLVKNPLAQTLRRTLVPQSIRNKIKQNFQMRERPELSQETKKRLKALFDEDTKMLFDLLK